MINYRLSFLVPTRSGAKHQDGAPEAANLGWGFAELVDLPERTIMRLEAFAFFELSSADARQHAASMARATAAGRWLRAEGLSAGEVRQYRDGFEHADAETALSPG
ncbi:MAG: hypothetical protein KXJ53_00645 [Phenylobacterium sp.]|nr:hypothetical protein [Phenylobacterium sp.]